MKYELDFETALEVLQSFIFDDDLSIGAMEFVSTAFNVSIDSLLEKIKYKNEIMILLGGGEYDIK